MQNPILTRIARRPRRRAGAAIVEAAIVLPIVLLFIMGLFEYGRYYLMIHVCENAVAAGAAYACKHTSPIVITATNGTTTTYGDATTDVQNIVNSNLGSQQLASPTITVYLSDAFGNAIADSAGNNPGLFTYASVGQYICVKLTGTYTFVPATMLGLPTTKTETFITVRRSEAN
ncbi:MAG: TadE family protein [Thermoguttaceae bacterium]